MATDIVVTGTRPVPNATLNYLSQIYGGGDSFGTAYDFGFDPLAGGTAETTEQPEAESALSQTAGILSKVLGYAVAPTTLAVDAAKALVGLLSGSKDAAPTGPVAPYTGTDYLSPDYLSNLMNATDLNAPFTASDARIQTPGTTFDEIVVSGSRPDVTFADNLLGQFSDTDYLSPEALGGLLGTADTGMTDEIVVTGKKPAVDLSGQIDYLDPNLLNSLMGGGTTAPSDEIVVTGQKPSVDISDQIDYLDPSFLDRLSGGTADTGGDIVVTGAKPDTTFTGPSITVPGVDVTLGGGTFGGGDTGGTGTTGTTNTDLLTLLNLFNTPAAQPTPYGGTQLRAPTAPTGYTVSPFTGDYEQYGFGPGFNFYSPGYYGIVPAAAAPTTSGTTQGAATGLL